ncbi:6-pyruvoyl trahydropterin synthase family protein [Dichotomicrobium thermohalophilum]|uniref:6-carboxy-5,6,7,8-tetrahydropterin synthase n=1 Tax=Dichotomicrobium thermohalophilum TaxID=933063 RepID=A0A397Q9U9_9HYPH|nr:6-carboxytetrahydropterin synthase [Dichotomicrobium thermohalophilum]RIA55021.1 6-pyruvoyl-tetrahydropterin synthase [Dichotomicrobium thermohalophilum]
MYSVEVSDHIMIAHSLKKEFFGPAQNLHGATFVITVAFFRQTLTENNVVVDIGRALDVLNEVLSPLRYANLDEKPEFAGQLTTTEFLCRHIFDQFALAVRDGRLGDGAEGLERIRVTLQETPNAAATYEGRVGT